MSNVNATAKATEKPQSNSKKWLSSLSQGGLIIALVVLILFFFAMRPDMYLGFTNLKNIVFQAAILVIIASAQTIVMVVGDFDLSVGTTALLSGSIAAIFAKAEYPLPVAILIGLLVGIAVGAFNGFLVAYVGISAFIVTLAVYFSEIGLFMLVTDGHTLFGFPDSFNELGQGRLFTVPLPVYFAAVVAVLVWLLLRFTTLGRRWYAVGGNAEVSRLSGVGVRRTRFLAFVVTSFISAFAGVLLVSRMGSAAYGADGSYMMYSVAAVFLGMTILKSGLANLGGTMVGVGVIAVLQNGMSVMQVNSYLQQVITGLVIIAAVTLSALRNRGRQ